MGPKGRSCSSIWLCRAPPTLSPRTSLLPRVPLCLEEIHGTVHAAVCFSCHLSVADSIHRHSANASRESLPGRKPQGSYGEMIKNNFFDLATLTLKIYSCSQFPPTYVQTHSRFFTIWNQPITSPLPPTSLPKFLSVLELEMSCSFWTSGPRPHI